MPISKSAKKALKSAEVKASRNRYRKSLLKEALKKADLSVISATSKTEDKVKLVAGAYSAVDKAVKWGIIHQNKAARFKSRIGQTITTAPVKPTTKPVTKAKVTAKKKSPATKKTS